MGRGLLVGCGRARVRKFLRYLRVTAAAEMGHTAENELVIERRAQNSGDEMGEV